MINCIIVDDEPHCIRSLSRHVEQTTDIHLLKDFMNPLNALEAIRSGTLDPDLVFLDNNMPQMDGLDLLKLLPNRVTVILVTGNPEAADEARENGAADVLFKPVSYARFEDSLNKVKSVIAAKQKA